MDIVYDTLYELNGLNSKLLLAYTRCYAKRNTLRGSGTVQRTMYLRIETYVPFDAVRGGEYRLRVDERTPAEVGTVRTAISGLSLALTYYPYYPRELGVLRFVGAVDVPETASRKITNSTLCGNCWNLLFRRRYYILVLTALLQVIVAPIKLRPTEQR